MNRFNAHVSGTAGGIRLISLLALIAAACYVRVQAQDPWPWDAGGNSDAVTLILLGDFNVQRRERPVDALIHVRETLNQADLVYANLEGLLVPSRGPAEDLPNKSGWIHLGPESVQALLAGNVAAVGVANNVAFGRENIMASLGVLDENGIAHTGAGANIEQAHQPVIVERRGVKFGFLQYTSKWYDEAEQMATADAPGVARLKSPDGETIDRDDLQRALDDIRRLRPLVDILVVATHTRDGQGLGGAAVRTPRAGQADGDSNIDDLYSHLPVNERLQIAEPYQKLLARTAIDAGADIVFGHGCHMLQEVEIYRGKPIMHCLGNFASDWIRVRDYRDGLVARVSVQNKKLSRVSLVPVTRDPETNNVRLVTPAEADGVRLYGKLRSLSPSTPLPLQGQELLLLDNRP